jgi:hypothetical protein
VYKLASNSTRYIVVKQAVDENVGTSQRQQIAMQNVFELPEAVRHSTVSVSLSDPSHFNLQFTFFSHMSTRVTFDDVTASIASLQHYSPTRLPPPWHFHTSPPKLNA